MNKELWDLVDEKYDGVVDWRQNGLLNFIYSAVQEYGHEEELLAYLKENPEATVDEFDAFAAQFWPPVEIVDDEELTDEERADQDDW